MGLKEYELTAEPFNPAMLSVTITKEGIPFAHAFIPIKMWDNKKYLEDIIKSAEHMRKKRIGAAFFHGKGGL